MKVFLSYKIYTYRNCALVRYRSALFSKEIIEKISKKLLSTSSGGISGILLPFTNVFKMAQYVLGAVAGPLSYYQGVHGISIWKNL